MALVKNVKLWEFECLGHEKWEKVTTLQGNVLNLETSEDIALLYTSVNIGNKLEVLKQP